MEFAVGRGSQKSIAKSFNELEPKGSKWHIYRYFGIAGNYLLMMFYTTVAGWMLAYVVKNAARCVHRRVRRGGGRHFQ